MKNHALKFSFFSRMSKEYKMFFPQEAIKKLHTLIMFYKQLSSKKRQISDFQVCCLKLALKIGVRSAKIFIRALFIP